jgi:SAM-dependent methyltransferase
MALLNPRQEIVSLLRGWFACPVISCLGEMGVLNRMAQSPFSLDDFPQVANRAGLAAIFEYLISLGVLARCADGENRYQASPLGAKVFQRYGAFCLLHSYRDYFDRLPALLNGAGPSATVNRLRNVIGSGQLHAKKFFPTALNFLGERSCDAVVDVGCGDGQFLLATLKAHPNTSAVAVDSSAIAVQTTLERLQTEFPNRSVRGEVANGFEVEAWSQALSSNTKTAVVTLWFVVHEFSDGQPERVIEFFRRLRACCPNAEVIVGEIVNVPAELLADSRDDSIMPEFLLFHSLSGQGVLSWEQHQQVLAGIPYKLVNEQRFDVVESIPSSFIWHLQPSIRA